MCHTIRVRRIRLVSYPVLFSHVYFLLQKFSFQAHMVKQESLANAKVRARQRCSLKTDFDMKWALKVIQFATNFRGSNRSISPFCTDSLMCNVSEVSEIAENCRRRRPQCNLTPPPAGARPGEPWRKSAYTLYFRKPESFGYIFVADTMGLSAFV